MTILDSEHGRKAVEAMRRSTDNDHCSGTVDGPVCAKCLSNALAAALPHLAEAFAEAVDGVTVQIPGDGVTKRLVSLTPAATFLRTLR